MKRSSLWSLLLLSIVGVSATVGCAATSDENDTSESELRGRQPVSDVTDFLSGGEFGCLAEDASGRQADISISIGVPRQHKGTWLADGSYQVRQVGGGREQFWSQTRGRPISTVVGGPLTIRSGWGGVVCEYVRTTTGPDGQQMTRRFEGEVVRFSDQCFDERFYLQQYPDIAQAVASGAWLSGRMHWEEYGKRDRQGCAGGGGGGGGGGGSQGYIGCYTDNESRELPHAIAMDRSDMTPNVCRSLCRSAGYNFAGTQFHSQCFCGNDLRGQRVADAECNTPCTGDNRKMCGGTWRNSIYTTR